MEETCNDRGHHFWKPNSEVCQCGELRCGSDPLAWPTPIAQSGRVLKGRKEDRLSTGVQIIIRGTDNAADALKKTCDDLQRVDRHCLILVTAVKKCAAAFGALAGVANWPLVKLAVQAAERKAIRDLGEKR